MTTARLIVEVTAEDIERGQKRADRCPIARAIRRVTPIRPVAVFGGNYLMDGAEIGNVPYKLPWAAHDFIREYDGGLPVQPFVFVMDGPA